MSTTGDNFASLFGARLSEERRRIGLSQEAAGDACGVSREMWGRYERGRAVMGTEVLARFAHACGDVLYVLTGERASSAEAPSDLYRHVVLLRNFERLTEPDKVALERIASALARDGRW